jgi:hypothetical protein
MREVLVVSRYFGTATMSEYKFRDADFALSEEGLHLLRSGYNYRTISYRNIENVTFRNASAVRSPFWAVLIGLAFVGLSLLQSYRVFQQFQDPTVHQIYVEAIVVVILPSFIGVYLLYVALKKELLLIVTVGKTRRKLSVKGLRAKGKLAEMEQFLSEKLGTFVWT